MTTLIYPHRIRLRGPWGIQPLTEPAMPPRMVKMPCRWAVAAGPGFTGRVRCCRSFGNLGRLDATERVWLTFSGFTCPAEVRLNGTLLGAALCGASDFEVTNLLGQRNQLELTMTAGPDQEDSWEEVALEVRATAYLRGVRVYRGGSELHVAGEVAGFADKPLELYVLRDRSNVAYRTIEAGQAFHLVIPKPPPTQQPGRVRIELVNVSVKWHAVELPWPEEEDGRT